MSDVCRNGHQRTYANTRVRTGNKQGTVLCRECARESTRRRRRKASA